MKTQTWLTQAIVASAMAISAIAAGQTADKDRQFVETAMQGGMKEVEMAKIAADRGGAEVKTLAARLISDHMKANSELSNLASQKSIAMPTASPNAASMPFATRSGADFDKEFLRLMLADHQKDIALFEQEANSGSDAELKKWANQTLPTLRSHLDEIKNLMK